MADAIPPIFLATAVQAVIKAGAMQLGGIDHLHVEKKGTIDLVTQIDREVETMFRALIADRNADPVHRVLVETSHVPHAIAEDLHKVHHVEQARDLQPYQAAGHRH